ncbi:MAG: EamA family transporter RarD [Burkholderiales bacterium]|nr:EamA family transporter RarD [Burkholderiales bacterium]
MNPGILSAGLAYACWGLFPLYFKQLASIAPIDVLVHRIVWSLIFLLLVLSARKHWSWLAEAVRRPKVIGAFAVSALLLSANWLTYIWSVTHGHVIDASLGYFITPLVNVLLGYTVLKERLRPAQWAAVGLAAAGVMWLAMQGGQFPWIALVLACTFGGYGLMRKTATLGALEGLALETMLLAPPALAMLAFSAARGESSFPADSALVNAMLIGIGPVTAIPLLLFAAGARRIRMSTLGILQYIGPTIQFGLGVWLFNEPFAGPRIVGFLLIWAALVIYSMEGLLQTSAVQRTVLEPD